MTNKAKSNLQLSKNDIQRLIFATCELRMDDLNKKLSLLKEMYSS